jgi:hypothetical protein
MRKLLLAVLLIASSPAIADEVDDAHKLAITGRDAYWNCLAREYPLDSNKAKSDEQFTALIASVCPSERQNFRVSLIDFLTMQAPNDDSTRHLDTANRAIELAQKDIVSAFAKRHAAAK